MSHCPGGLVKNLPAGAGNAFDPRVRKIPTEKGMATLFSILAWKIPWTEETGSYSPWGGKELDTTEQMSTHALQDINQICD